MGSFSGPLEGGTKAVYNIPTKTVIKASPGVIYRVLVVTAPSTAGGIYDSATSGGTSAANRIDTISTGGQAGTPAYNFTLNWPCANGITIDPGTGGVVSVSYS